MLIFGVLARNTQWTVVLAPNLALYFANIILI
jgi:hypothetical protein